MKDFKSKSLGKSFKEIIFASDVYLPEKRDLSPIKNLKDMLGLSAPKPKTVEVKKEEKSTKPFEEKEFYTVEEAFIWKNSLKGKMQIR